ncbi:hypothetical protein GCM10023157_32410 [Gluconacetobacter asukensis]
MTVESFWSVVGPGCDETDTRTCWLFGTCPEAVAGVFWPLVDIVPAAGCDAAPARICVLSGVGVAAAEGVFWPAAAVVFAAGCDKAGAMACWPPGSWARTVAKVRWPVVVGPLGATMSAWRTDEAVGACWIAISAVVEGRGAGFAVADTSA